MACVRNQCLWVSWTSSCRHQHPFTGMGWESEGGGGGGNLRCLDPWQVLYKPSLLGAKNEKTKRILMCEVTVFAYSKHTAFSDLRSLLFFCVKNAVFSRKCDPCVCVCVSVHIYAWVLVHGYESMVYFHISSSGSVCINSWILYL